MSISVRQMDLRVSKVFDKNNFFSEIAKKMKQQNFLCIFGQIPLYLKSAGSHRQMMSNLSENFCVHSVGHMSLQEKR